MSVEDVMPSFSRKKTYSLHGHDKTSVSNTNAVSGPLLSLSSRNRVKAVTKKRVGRASVRRKKGRFKSAAGGINQQIISSDFQEVMPVQPLPGEAELNALFAKMVVRH